MYFLSGNNQEKINNRQLHLQLRQLNEKSSEFRPNSIKLPDISSPRIF